MRRRRDQSPSAGILQSEEPIDTADQELLVRRLEFKQKEQAEFGCRTLALLFICAGLLQIYLCGQQLWRPASSKLLFQLKGANSFLVALTFLVHGLTYLQTAIAASTINTSTASPWTSSLADWCLSIIAGAMGVYVVWSKQHQPAFKSSFVQLWWLVLGPLLASSVKVWLHRMFNGTVNDLKQMRAQMYSHKTA